MLLQALHKYAEQRNLLERLPFQVRNVHLLIPLNKDGSVRGSGFVPLTTPVKDGEKTKEKPGQRMILPRFPGEKNNTRAQYLCDPLRVVLGLAKDSAEPLPDPKTGQVPAAVQQHRMFWRWVEDARQRMQGKGIRDARLEAIDAFRRRHLEAVRHWVSMWTNTNARRPKPEVVVTTEGRNRYRLSDGDVLGFEIAGEPFVVLKGGVWSGVSARVDSDPLWADWRDEFRIRFVQEVGDVHLGVDQPSLCIVTGTTGLRVAKIHKPEVKIDGTPPKGASFFSVMKTGQSFGKGAAGTASVSIDAAASYALAFEELLSSNDTRLKVDGVTFCFWAEKNPAYLSANARLLRAANTKAVDKFLKAPFDGIERGIAKKDSFLSVAMSANGGRIAVKKWLCLPLDEAIEHFKKWFEELAVASLVEEISDGVEKSGPYSLRRLTFALLPKAKGEKSDSSRSEVRNRIILELYSKAIEGTPVSLSLLPRLLEEYVTALITDNPKQKKQQKKKNERTYPLNRSRFALFKLILIRNHEEGEFMPRVHLAADTSDQAYNLGRLLAILARVQKKAHEVRKNGKVVKKLEGPGIVQRYYAGASTSPRTVFPVLFKLNMHHLRKLEQNGDPGVRTAEGFRATIGDVVKLIPKDKSGGPDFKAVLDLKDQARFALGYYQQHAYDRAASRVGHLLGEAKRAHKNKDAKLAEQCLDNAKKAVKHDDYPDLFHRVNNFKLEPN
ncbi:MAG: type I-C CRISPR-associated protein Cas8c/Csd1 [Gemmataceae bacterium]